MTILPYPQRLTLGTKMFFFGNNLTIKVHNIDPSNNLIIQIRDELFEDLQFSNVTIENGLFEENNQIPELNLTSEQEEGYGISISENGIFLQAYSLHGIFNAFQSFRQIIYKYRNFSNTDFEEIGIPELEIIDWPDMAIRGFTDDISRGQVPTVDSIKRFIKNMSQFKNNFYGLYIEDMFRCTAYPEIGEDRGALTPDELIEIDQYARSHYVTLFPIFECLGHMDNILMHPSYRELGEFPGAQSFALSNGNIFTFFRNITSELSACFSSKIFHMGCDESFDVGKGKSKDYIKRIGMEAALLRHYQKIYEIVKENGFKTIIMYHDVVLKYPKILQQLPKDIIIMYWNYTAKKDYPLLKKIIGAGFRVIVSGAIHCWNRSYLDLEQSLENNINLIRYAKKINFERQINQISIDFLTPGILGQINSTWGGFGHPNLRENDLYGVIISGIASWVTYPQNNIIIYNNIGSMLFGIQDVVQQKNFGNFLSEFCKLSSILRKKPSIISLRFYSLLFRHPFRTEDHKPNLKHLDILNKKIQDLYQQGQVWLKSINQNEEIFRNLLFNIHLILLLIVKEETSEYVQKFIKNIKGEFNEFQKQLLWEKLEKCILLIKMIIEEYEQLWLKSAKRPHLDFNLNRFQQLQHFFEEKKTEIEKNIKFRDPMLPSFYIWTNERVSKPRFRYFRKKFGITGDIINARIQVIAGNFTEVYVNGEFIGEVLSRMSLSFIPFSQSIKVFDITVALKNGENVIGILADHYLNSIGSINLYGEIAYITSDQNEAHMIITTDESWEFNYGPYAAAEWCVIGNEDKQQNWYPVKQLGRSPTLNLDIYRPDLLKGQRSYPQELFGLIPNIQFISEGLIPSWFIKILQHLLLKFWK